MNRNQHVLAIAFKKAKGKRGAIKRLGIVPDMDSDAKKALIYKLAEAKADAEGKTAEPFIEGQEWYVNSLVEFSGKTAQEQLDSEYEDAFPTIAGEDELLAALEAS